jgi:hypothetical protein
MKWNQLTDDQIRRRIALSELNDMEGSKENYEEQYSEEYDGAECKDLVGYVVQEGGYQDQSREELLEAIGATEDEEISGVFDNPED